MGFFQDIFKKTTKLYRTEKWFGFGTRMHNRKYADIILHSLFNQIFNAVETIHIWRQENTIEPMEIINARKIITQNFRAIIWDLYSRGYFVLLHRGHDIEYLPAKYVSRIGDDGMVMTEIGAQVEASVFYEKTYEATGQTQKSICQSTLDYIDNVLNTATTGNAKLGNLIIFSPSPNEVGGEVLTDDEKTEIENKISTNYGGLDTQSNFMLMPKSLQVSNVSFDFGKLQLLPQLEMSVKNLCGYLNIPYDILPLSGQSTFNNQETAYSQLYTTAERWVMYLQDAFAILDVDFKFELKGKPNTEKVKTEQAKKDAVATMAQAVASGLMTIEEARNELKQHYNI